MSIGATLRHTRETRGLTCEDVARATRIPNRMIAAMEKDDWGKLPGGIFTRGFLRAYARELGMDGEALVAQYEAEHTPPPEPVRAEERPVGREWHVVVRLPQGALPKLPWNKVAWPTLAAGVLLVLYFTAGGGPTQQGRANTETRGADSAAGPAHSLGAREDSLVGTTALGAREDSPVGTAAVPAASRRRIGDIELPAPGAETPLAMDLAVTRPCWLAVTVDGRRQIYRLVQPGERQRQQGLEFVIRAGDAGALQLSLDGEAARPLGSSGEVVTVRITRDNYRTLIQPL